MCLQNSLYSTHHNARQCIFVNLDSAVTVSLFLRSYESGFNPNFFVKHATKNYLHDFTSVCCTRALVDLAGFHAQ